MAIKYKILNWAEEFEVTLMFADGFEDAIMGVCQQFNNYSVLYDYNKCIKILMERDGMNDEEAEEYMQYNVLGAYVGENTPSFLIV